MGQKVKTDLGKDAAVLRLIAAPGAKAGEYLAGIDIVMKPGSHTYWKMPGEAGVPPVFSFNGSQNVAKADVRYPVPKRITEQGLDAFGYDEKVAFPVDVTPIDPGKPATLDVDVVYAVCSKICVPAHGTASIVLPSGASEAGATALAAARAQLPAPMSAAQRSKLQITPTPGAAKPSWSLAWSGEPAIRDIFATAPTGYYFDTKKIDATHWSLVASQIVSAPGVSSVPVELTLSEAEGGLVTSVPLDVGGKAK